jgi:hypothetical protein
VFADGNGAKSGIFQMRKNFRIYLNGFAISATMFGLGFVLLGVTPGFAQRATPQPKNIGGVPIRIPDQPTPRCINGSTDQVWLTLYRVVMTKKSDWFGLTSSNQAEVVITVQVKTKPQSTQNLSYPLSSKVSIREYNTGQISLPVEYNLVSGLNLKQKDANGHDVIYTGFGVDTTVINVKSEGALGATLAALAQLTGSKKLPIPDTPYTQAAGYLLDFANTAVTNEIANQNADNKYTTAALAFNFDPDGLCNDSAGDGQGFETSGTKAILMADGIPGDGYVPIDAAGDYCWTAETRPVFVVKAAKKQGDKACTDLSYATLYKPITNNYVAYFLQKRTPAAHLGGQETVQRDIEESKTLCALLEVADCPAAKL